MTKEARERVSPVAYSDWSEEDLFAASDDSLRYAAETMPRAEPVAAPGVPGEPAKVTNAVPPAEIEKCE